MSGRATSSRPLLVPAADILAKNLRAFAQASAAPPSSLKSTDNTAPTLLMDLGGNTEQTVHTTPPARFRRAAQPSRSNLVSSLFSRITNPSTSAPPSSATAKPGDSSAAEPRASSLRPDTIVLSPVVEKALPHLERAANLLSRLPNPNILFLSVTLFVLVVSRLRPHWLAPLSARLAVVFVLFLIILVALLWRRGPFLAMLRQHRNPFTHPAEHRLDGAEAELTARETRVRAAQETLRKNRAQLDALLKELAKDPNAAIPNAVIVPSRKAAAMIAAGALGAGYDADTAQEVEQRRREESVQRCREEWRLKVETETNESERQITKESMRKLADHAHTAYTTRTRELKTRSAAATRGDKFINLKMVASKASAARKKEQSLGRGSRVSERSFVESVATADSGGRRRGLFRRKRRETAPNLKRATMSESDGEALQLSEV